MFNTPLTLYKCSNFVIIGHFPLLLISLIRTQKLRDCSWKGSQKGPSRHSTVLVVTEKSRSTWTEICFSLAVCGLGCWLSSFHQIIEYQKLSLAYLCPVLTSEGSTPSREVFLTTNTRGLKQLMEQLFDFWAKYSGKPVYEEKRRRHDWSVDLEAQTPSWWNTPRQ